MDRGTKRAGIKLITFMSAAVLVVFFASAFFMPSCTFIQRCLPYQEYIQKECPFCAIVQGKAPAVVLYEDDLVIAIEKRPARKPVDCLIIPKKHLVNLRELNVNDPCDAAIALRLIQVAQVLSTRLTGTQDFSLLSNNGPYRQSVFHLHVHFKSPEQWK